MRLLRRQQRTLHRRVAEVDLADTAVLGALMATDGYGNAQVAQVWESVVSAELAGLIATRPVSWIVGQLQAQAGQCASVDGSADDTTLALLVGLGAVNLIKPGAGVQLKTADEQKTEDAQKLADKSKQVTFKDQIEHLAPTSIFKAGAENDVLQVVIYAIIFGIALARVKGKPRQAMVRLSRSQCRAPLHWMAVQSVVSSSTIWRVS